jgi:hypothetical protein
MVRRRSTVRFRKGSQLRGIFRTQASAIWVVPDRRWSSELPDGSGLALVVAVRWVYANFVGADAFLLVADLIWMHSHIQMRNLLVSASYARPCRL